MDKKKKVCFVTCDYNFFKVYIANLAEKISEKYSVTVITDTDTIKNKDLIFLKEKKINIEHLDNRSKFSKLKIIRYIYTLKKIVNEVSPDYIFYSTIEISFFGSLITRFRANRRSYFIITGIGLDFFSKKLRYKILNFIYLLTFKTNKYKENTLYIFQNIEDRSLFVKAGYVTENNSEVIPHFGTRLASIDDSEKLGADFVNFFFAGRLVKSKGVGELIQATENLGKKYSNFRTIIAGPESPESGDPITSSQRKSLEESDFINYIGKIVFEDMYSLYQKYDVFVLPSHREGFSTVALEAAANGMPLIITNAPGCIECFNSNGFLIQPKDSSSLEKAMERFIIDPKLIDVFSKKSYEHVKNNYSIAKMAQAYLSLMKKNTNS
tara:strand:- start:1337 stop:2479 length:1143 start_codon:yes stop_codon:yes gene_type:complete